MVNRPAASCNEGQGKSVDDVVNDLTEVEVR